MNTYQIRIKSRNEVVKWLNGAHFRYPDYQTAVRAKHLIMKDLGFSGEDVIIEPYNEKESYETQSDHLTKAFKLNGIEYVNTFRN